VRSLAEHPAGDHWIVAGRVDHLRSSPIQDPLLFFAGEFGAFESAALRGVMDMP
jgi:hypothetical protein